MSSRVKDLTFGTPWKIILLFAIPICLSYLLQQLYNVFDLYMIGNMLNETSFSAVGTTTPLNLFFLMFATGVATGFSVIISQRFGNGDIQGVKKSFITGLIWCFIIGIVITIISILLCGPLLLLLGLEKDSVLFQEAFRYIVIIFLGTIANIYYNYFASVLRAVGNTKMPLVFLTICAILNIGLNYVFIQFTPLGVMGAAIGTVISQTVSVIASFIYIQKQYPEFKISLKELKIEKEESLLHLKRGFPMGVQFSFLYIALMVLQRQINAFDEGAIAAFSAANKIDALIMQPTNAIGTAMVTYVGQNFGAGKYKRIKTGIKQMALVQIIISTITTLIALSIKDVFIKWMVAEPSKEALEYAPIVMLFISLSQYSIAFIFLFRNCLQATNHSFSAMIVSIIQAICRILICIFFPMFIGFYGVAVATPISWLVSSICLFIMCWVLVFNKLPNKDHMSNKERIPQDVSQK